MISKIIYVTEHRGNQLLLARVRDNRMDCTPPPCHGALKTPWVWLRKVCTCGGHTSSKMLVSKRNFVSQSKKKSKP